MKPPSIARSPETLTGEATIFGLPSTVAAIEVVRRPQSVRTARTVAVLVGTLLLAPLVFLVPPHAPWGIGVVLGGIAFARNQWLHSRSVVGLDACCPSCGEALGIPGGSRMRSPHSLSCEHCHRAVVVRLDDSEGA